MVFNIRHMIFFLTVPILLVLLGCRLFQDALSPTSPTQAPPKISTSPSPTTQAPTIVPTEKPPAIIPGIDEPIIVKGASYKDSLGRTVKKDVMLQILDAETAESKEAGGSGLTFPKDRSNVFLTLMINPILNVNALDWVVLNTELRCRSRKYKAVSAGLKIGNDGRLGALLITYEVPSDGDFSECVLHLAAGEGISLAPFFE